jgi:hypothetical protein
MKKTLYGFCVVFLVTVNIVMAIGAANTEVCAARWADRVTSFQNVRELNQEILLAHEYSENLIESVRMLALENGILCERDKAATEVVVQYEEESRRLKMSLAEACKRLEEQIVQINELSDEVEGLRWQVETLEKALDKVKTAEPDQSDKKGNTEQ